MKTTAVEDVLNFWFPSLPDGDLTARVQQWDWWFRGGGDTAIVARFSPLLEYRPLLEFSAAQARRHRDVIAQFGRQPHRNEILGRHSTPAELEYLATGQFVHKQSFPPDLMQFLIQH